MKGQPQIQVMPFSCEQLYKLVADVKNYPIFLPWCSEAIIHKATPEELLADLSIGYGAISETFTSQVSLEPFQSIRVNCVKGPLNNLKNIWKFRALNEKETEVEFVLEYEFKNPFFQMAMDAIYPKVFAKMTEAFEKRACEIYST